MKKEEQYIIDESPEVSSSFLTQWASTILHALPALRHRNYALYFWNQLISLSGTWLQMVAQGYLVYEITESPFWVGLIAALNFLPVMLFSLFGGVIVDRFKKRSLLYVTQTCEMFLAFGLGALTLAGLVDRYHIAFFSFALGCLSALDMPARQSFMVELVPKKDLPSAISLNAGSYNLARVIGPMFAGILISVFGIGGAFVLNGVSFIPVLFALYNMRIEEVVRDSHPHPIRAIKQGLAFAKQNNIIKPLLVLSAFSAVFGWSYVSILPVVAKDVFLTDARGLGYLQSGAGVGAVFGAILVSMYAKKADAYKFIFGGSVIFSIGLLFFTFTSTLTTGAIMLSLSGFGMILFFSTINATIQKHVTNEIRGRVMSIYTLCFLGMAPLGSLWMGFSSEYFGAMHALQANAFISLASTGLVYYLNQHLKQA